MQSAVADFTDWPPEAAEKPCIGGALSPSLGEGIGMAYLPPAAAKVGTPIEVEIRGRRFPARIVKKPFYRKA